VLLISFTLLLALCLAIVPLPAWGAWLRPAWVALVLVYWTLALPHHISLGFAWVIGLLMDIIDGTLFGEHALALVIVSFCVIKLHRQVAPMPLWLQPFFIGFFILLYQLTLFLVQGTTGQVITYWQFWVVPLVSLFYWPWLYIVLQSYRRRYRLR
jgi:rod shape-determining protein MreD